LEKNYRKKNKKEERQVAVPLHRDGRVGGTLGTWEAALELHCMRILTSREGESRVEVSGKLIDLLAGSNELLINLLLELHTCRVNRELLPDLGLQVLAGRGIAGKEASSTLAELGSLGLLEESVSDILHINARDVNLGGGGNDVSSSDATKRNTVELIGARDQKETALKTLQEDCTAAGKATSNDDDDCARGKRLAECRKLGNLLLALAAALPLALKITLNAHVGLSYYRKKKKKKIQTQKKTKKDEEK